MNSFLLDKQFILKNHYYIYLKTPCNNNCIFCHGGRSRFDKFNYDINWLKNEIKFISSLGFRGIAFSGNEVLNHPKIVEIVRHSRMNRFLYIKIDTTGMKLKETNFLDKLIKEGVNEFAIPMYGSNRKYHEAITKTPGSFDDIIIALDNISRHNITLTIRTMLTNSNFKNIPNLTKLIVKKYPKAHFQINYISAFSNSLEEYKKIAPEFKKMLPFLRKATAFYHRENEFNVSSLLSFCMSFGQIPVCIAKMFYREYLFYLFIFLKNIQVRYRMRFKDFPYEKNIKLSFCASCKFCKLCLGISKFYIKSYGKDEFRPIR